MQIRYLSTRGGVETEKKLHKMTALSAKSRILPHLLALNSSDPADLPSTDALDHGLHGGVRGVASYSGVTAHVLGVPPAGVDPGTRPCTHLSDRLVRDTPFRPCGSPVHRRFGLRATRRCARGSFILRCYCTCPRGSPSGSRSWYQA